MPEDIKINFAFPKFTFPVSGMLREIVDNYITTRDKIYLNGLEMKKYNMEAYI